MSGMFYEGFGFSRLKSVRHVLIPVLASGLLVKSLVHADNQVSVPAGNAPAAGTAKPSSETKVEPSETAASPWFSRFIQALATNEGAAVRVARPPRLACEQVSDFKRILLGGAFLIWLAPMPGKPDPPDRNRYTGGAMISSGWLGLWLP